MPGRAQPRHHVEQPLHLARRERGRGLVEDDQRGPDRERLRDLDQLPLRAGQPLHFLSERQRLALAEALENSLRPRPQRAEAQSAGARKLRQEHVLQHGEVGCEARLLHHHRDAGADRLAGVARRQRRAAPDDAAAIALQVPADDARERGLAGPVRAEQPVHLACGKLSVGAGERAGPVEALLDPTRNQQRRRRRPLDRHRRSRHQDSSPANTVLRIVGNSSATFLLVTTRIGTVVSFGTLSPFRCASSASADFTPIRYGCCMPEPTT